MVHTKVTNVIGSKMCAHGRRRVGYMCICIFVCVLHVQESGKIGLLHFSQYASLVLEFLKNEDVFIHLFIIKKYLKIQEPISVSTMKLLASIFL